MDVRMPGKGGLEVLRDSRDGKFEAPVIVMTAFSTANMAIEAIQLGAYEYISKPFDLDHVLVTINNFFKRQELAKQVEVLQERLAESDPNERIVGNTAPMQEVYKTIGRVARSDISVLITGETGTGKESVATAIHRNSTYADRKSTRLNSSHANISYAVFCLKKKKKTNEKQSRIHHTLNAQCNGHIF